MRPIHLCSLLLIACGGKEESAEGPAPPAPVPSDEVECGDNGPTVEALTITDNGFFSCEAQSWPSALLLAEVSDPDGDLTFYTYRVWWDTVLDGAVDTGGSYVEVYETLADDACTIGDADVGLILCITGNPPYETDVEFGVVIYDQKGNPSNGGAAFIATFRTPDSNGNY